MLGELLIEQGLGLISLLRVEWQQLSPTPLLLVSSVCFKLSIICKRQKKEGRINREEGKRGGS